MIYIFKKTRKSKAHILLFEYPKLDQKLPFPVVHGENRGIVPQNKNFSPLKDEANSEKSQWLIFTDRE